MPAGPIGACWKSGTWSDTAWATGSWAGATPAPVPPQRDTVAGPLLPPRPRVRPATIHGSVDLLLPDLEFQGRLTVTPANVTAHMELALMALSAEAAGTMTPATMQARAHLNGAAFDAYISIGTRDTRKGR